MSPARAYWIAVALLLIPFAAGLLAGLGQRAIRRTPNNLPATPNPGILTWPFGATLFAVAAIGLAVMVGVQLRVGLWDDILVGALFAMGGLLCALARRPRRADVALAVGATAISLLIAEGLDHALLRPGPSIPTNETSQLVLPRRLPIDLNDPQLLSWPPNMACAMLYPAVYPGVFEERTARSGRRHKTVLHVGDSMVQGWGVPADRAFPAVIEKLDGNITHVNAALYNTTIDYEYLIAHRWLDNLHADLVVLYPFAGSDLYEMDAPFPCCHDGPLLDYVNGTAVDRCPRPDFSSDDTSFDWIRLHSPAPQPLRAATGFSDVARHLVTLFRRDLNVRTSLPLRWEHYRAALRALRDELAQRRVPLLVVLLPSRTALIEEPEPADRPFSSETGNAQMILKGMREACRDLQIEAIDASETVRQWLRDDSPERWFLPDQIHFTVEAHERFAAWLRPRLLASAALGGAGNDANPAR